MYDQKRLFSHNDVSVYEYDGPELGYSWKEVPASGNPKRYAVNVGGFIATFSRLQWETLAEYFGADCSTECEGPRLDKPLPDNWRWSDDA